MANPAVPTLSHSTTKYYYFGQQRVAVLREMSYACVSARRSFRIDFLNNLWQNCPGKTTGQIVSERRYHPFGLERYSDGSPQTDFGYTGQRDEAGFGLYDYQARYYDPLLGRFISPDMIVPDPTSGENFNRYSYALNNPIRYNDPSGHTVPIKCPICDIEIDISDWPDLAKQAAALFCFGFGCHVNFDENTLTGPTEEEWVNDSLTSIQPTGPVGATIARRSGKNILEVGLGSTNNLELLKKVNPDGNIIEPPLWL